MRCPRQWQAHYLFGEKGPASNALVIGSAVHLSLSRRLKGEPEGNYWSESVTEAGEIVWKEDEATSRSIAEGMVYHYYETIGKYLRVEKTEQEFNLTIEGVDIPVIGFVDVETQESIIDFKTTRYFSKGNVRVNPEWRLQQGIYQLVVPKEGEIHVLTRSKKDPVVVPSSKNDPLYFGYIDRDKTASIIRDEYARMQFYFDRYGAEEPWPGNSLHEWASKYCPLVGERCCKL